MHTSPSDAATLDRRSLTLPNWREALKRRLKRPRRRDRWPLLLAVFSAWSFYVNLAHHDIPFACTQGALAVLWFVSSESRTVYLALGPWIVLVVFIQTGFLIVSWIT